MSELPKGWFEATLGNVATWSSGGTPSRKNKEYYNGDIPWIKTGDLGTRYLEEASECISDDGLKNSSAKLFPKNSVAIAMYGATIGKTSILNIEAATNQACGVAIPNASLSSIFLYYLLKNEKEGFIARGKGGAQPNISQTIIKEYPIWLPPLNEQIRIANKLDSILAKVDKAQARLDKIPAILKRFRQSVLAAATSGELTKFKVENWQNSPLSNLLSAIADCPHSTPKWTEEGKLCVRTTAFKPFKLDLSSQGYVSEETYVQRTQRLKPLPGDVLYSREGAILGIACQIPNDTELCMGQRMLVMRAGNDIDAKYLTIYLNSPKITDVVKTLTLGNAAPRINMSTIKNFDISYPTLDQQREIVEMVELLFAKANKVEKQYLDAKTRLDRLTQSILAKAFRGELVPQDPNDEPAEQLLERILKEREQAKPKKAKPKTSKKRATKAKVADKG